MVCPFSVKFENFDKLWQFSNMFVDGEKLFLFRYFFACLFYWEQQIDQFIGKKQLLPPTHHHPQNSSPISTKFSNPSPVWKISKTREHSTKRWCRSHTYHKPSPRSYASLTVIGYDPTKVGDPDKILTPRLLVFGGFRKGQIEGEVLVLDDWEIALNGPGGATKVRPKRIKGKNVTLGWGRMLKIWGILEGRGSVYFSSLHLWLYWNIVGKIVRSICIIIN